MVPVFNDLMLTAEVAKYIRINRRTVLRMVERKEFATPIRLSPKRIAFRRADVEKWLASREGFTR